MYTWYILYEYKQLLSVIMPRIVLGRSQFAVLSRRRSPSPAVSSSGRVPDWYAPGDAVDPPAPIARVPCAVTTSESQRNPALSPVVIHYRAFFTHSAAMRSFLACFLRMRALRPTPPRGAAAALPAPRFVGTCTDTRGLETSDRIHAPGKTMPPRCR